jgi:hypothetical protein
MKPLARASGPAVPRLADLIHPVTSIDDVVRTMRAIDAALPDTDGVKWFNYLYLKVTEALLADEAAWQDWPFLQRFDVIFAGLYFDAVVQWETHRELTPHAWRPLFRARDDRGLARIQFALAGMNAHINHDLARTLEAIATVDGDYPSRDSGRFADFARVNDVLERMETALRPELATGLVGKIDLALGELDSLLMMWNVRKARDAAWTNGEVLWRLRALPMLQRDFLARLDLLTGFAGRGVLVPRLDVSRP